MRLSFLTLAASSKVSHETYVLGRLCFYSFLRADHAQLTGMVHSIIYSKECRGVARILLKGVLNLVALTRPLFLLLVGCIVLTSLATLSAFSLET